MPARTKDFIIHIDCFDLIVKYLSIFLFLFFFNILFIGIKALYADA